MTTTLTISGHDSSPEIAQHVRKVLIILDINYVLGKCQTATRFSPRPGVNDFLIKLTNLVVQEKIDVAFWTSKPKETAEPILHDLVSQALLEKTLFMWYRDSCTPTVIDGNPFHTIKDLGKVWRSFPQYTQKNTYLVDDTPSKCPEYPGNLIVAPPYLGPRKAPHDAGLAMIYCAIMAKLKATPEAND